MKPRLAGVYPPIPTPFTRTGDVDFDGLTANIHKWNETRLSGYVVLGSNGESVYLTESEKVDVLAATIGAAGEGKEVIAGTGCESTAATITLSQAAAEVGAVAALVLNPHFFGLSDAALEAHFVAVADASPIPVIVYNVPKFTGTNLDAPLVSRLATHANIVGLKDSSGNLGQMSSILGGSPSDFRVLSGTANIVYGACLMGCAGAISALANIAPNPLLDLVDLMASGDHQEARELQLRLLPANVAITATYGVPGLKAAMDMCGYAGGFPRKPLLPISPEEESIIRQILQTAGLLWLRGGETGRRGEEGSK